MSETIRENPIQEDLIREDPVQDVGQSFEDNEVEDEQLPTPERSPLHDDTTELIETTHQQIRSKTPDILQTGLNEGRHQEVGNPHTGMNRPFGRQGVGNLHTGMKGPQSFGRQSPHSFRAPQPFQSAIPTTSRELFTLPREERSLFESSRPFNESIRSLINTSDNSLVNSSIRSNEPRRHSAEDVLRVEIRSSQPSLMNQIDEIPTGQTSLEITDIFGRLNIADKIEKAKEIVKEKGKAKDQFKSSKPPPSRPIGSSDLDPANIIEGKRNRKPNPKYAQLVYEEWMKIPQFHAAFMAGVWTKEENEVKSLKPSLSEDAKYWSSRPHVSDLPPPPTHWRGMLKHPYAAQWQKAAQIEYDAINGKGTWKVVDRTEVQGQGVEIIPLKWVFTYKTDSDGFLLKFKARIVVRGDLQMVDNAQDVYAATLASKVFRMLMAMVAAYRLKTRQLDAVNAFLNAINDEIVYCYMPDGYKQPGKVFRVIRALYGQRKSPLLWLRTLTAKCLELGLKPIPGEPCLFTDGNGILMFFYVDDVIFAYRVDRQQAADELITRLNTMFEFRDLGEIKHFLGIRVIIQDENDGDRAVYLVQDAYVDKLMKEYEISGKFGKFQTPLPSPSTLAKYDGEIDQQRMHEYRQKVGSICYPATVTRPDIAKAASKLAEFLTNPGPDHLIAADHCMRYLQNTKYLGIKYTASGGGELTVAAEGKKHVFEATVDASFANEDGRKSAEGYAFKLFGGLIDWAAKKQATVSTSTTEAELLALLHGAKEYIWWIHLFKKLKFDPDQDLIIYGDNLQTIRLMKSEIARIDTKLRHIDVAQCWLREMVQNGHLHVEYLPTAKMVADGLTKLLPPQKHKEFVRHLGLVDVQGLIE
jgi:hypothetical protein